MSNPIAFTKYSGCLDFQTDFGQEHYVEDPEEGKEPVFEGFFSACEQGHLDIIRFLHEKIGDEIFCVVDEKVFATNDIYDILARFRRKVFWE